MIVLLYASLLGTHKFSE